MKKLLDNIEDLIEESKKLDYSAAVKKYNFLLLLLCIYTEF